MFTERKRQGWVQGGEYEGSDGQCKDFCNIDIPLHGFGFFSEVECFSEQQADSLHLQDTSDQPQ